MKRAHGVLWSSAIAVALGLAAPGTASAAVVSLFGDKDSFGTGKPDGSTVSVNEIRANSPAASDGPMDQWSLDNYVWVHIFLAPTAAITSAWLTISTIDVEDDGEGDGQGGGPFDELLYLDGVEVLGAFDDVFTAAADGNTQIIPNITTFVLDSSFFALLLDGELSVRIDPKGGAQKDSIAVDYAQLEIRTVLDAPISIPLPAALPLFGAGLALLGFVSRRRSQARRLVPQYIRGRLTTASKRGSVYGDPRSD